MFGIGITELIVILVVALIVLGPERLPEVAQALGKALGELRKATSGLTDELRDVTRSFDDKQIRQPRAPRPPVAPPAKPGESADAAQAVAALKPVPTTGEGATETPAEAAGAEPTSPDTDKLPG